MAGLVPSRRRKVMDCSGPDRHQWGKRLFSEWEPLAGAVNAGAGNGPMEMRVILRPCKCGAILVDSQEMRPVDDPLSVHSVFAGKRLKVLRSTFGKPRRGKGE